MDGEHHQAPGLVTLLGRLIRTALGALQNRVELFAAEWQEERLRVTELLVWTLWFVFLGVMAAMLITAVVIFLFPQEYRLYVTGAFALLYLGGSLYAWYTIKSMLKREPFAATIDQAKKDKEWLKSLD